MKVGRGVAADEVYRRPGNSVYTALSKGATFTEAVAAGRVVGDSSRAMSSDNRFISG